MKNFGMRLLLLGVVGGLAGSRLIGCSSAHRSDAMPPAKSSAALADRHSDTELARHENARAAELIRQEKYADAEKAANAALSADVAFGPAHNSLGAAYFHESKFYLSAWEFQYAAKLMPYQSEPRNNLGLVFEHVGKLDEAIGWFERARALEPDNPILIGNLARARVRRGDHDQDLRALLEDLIARDARSAWVQWAHERLALMKPSATPASTTMPTEPQ